MTYIQWRDELEGQLKSLPDEERQKVFSYFSEMYADKRDAGLTESQIINEFGAPYDVAQRILNENCTEGIEDTPLTKDEKDKGTIGEKSTVTTTSASTTGTTTERGKSKPNEGTTTERGKRKVHEGTTGESGECTSTEDIMRAHRAYASRTKEKHKHNWVKWVVLAVLIIAVLIAAANLCLFLIGRHISNNLQFETKTYTATTQTQKIKLTVDAGQFDIVFYDGEDIQITYPESDKFGYTIEQKDTILIIKPHNTFIINWMNIDNIPKATVAIPQGHITELSADIASGAIYISDGTFSNVDIEMSAGAVSIGNITCEQFDFDMSAGAAKMTSVTSTTFNFEMSAGAAEMGDITSAKATFDISAGAVKVSNLTSNGVYIDLSAGTLAMTINGTKSDYTVSVDKSAGSCNLTSQFGSAANKFIDITLSAGSVTVNFSN